MCYHTPRTAGSVLAHWQSYKSFSQLIILQQLLQIGEQRYQRTASPPLSNNSWAFFYLDFPCSPYARQSIFYILNLLFFTIFYLITGVMGYGWYHGDSHPVLRPRTGSRHRQQPTPNELVNCFLDGCKDIMSAAFSRPCRRYYRDTERQRACHRHHSTTWRKGWKGLGQVATVGMMYVIRTLINLDHSFRKCQQP